MSSGFDRRSKAFFRLISAGADHLTVPAMDAGWRSLWVEPRSPEQRRPSWLDRGLFAVFAVMVVLESSFREDVSWRPLAVAVAVIALVGVLWRRQKPFLAAVVVFSCVHGARAVAEGVGADWTGLFSTICVLFLPSALVRWGSHAQIIVGMTVIIGGSVLTVLDGSPLRQAAFGSVLLSVPALIGAVARLRARGREREIEQAKLVEREQLARELHDTVAHHVSAIVVQAQAGLTLANKRPEAAVEALQVIEEAAARSLTEMRNMVRTLRRDEAAELAPQPRASDLQSLSSRSSDDLPVEVRLSGDMDRLEPSVDAAVYRLVQESVTNARRHARRASLIRVFVVAKAREVFVQVVDDGEPSPAVDPEAASGFGLVGMAERAQLLGGTFRAGPAAGRGWMVEATLPRKG